MAVRIYVLQLFTFVCMTALQTSNDMLMVGRSYRHRNGHNYCRKLVVQLPVASEEKNSVYFQERLCSDSYDCDDEEGSELTLRLKK